MKKLIAVILQLLLAASAAAMTITEEVRVPNLTDLTATYQFTSDQEGIILYGGTCGNGDLALASIGSNTVTWTLAEGIYSDCTVTVNVAGVKSNTLSVPPFKATSKYPVIFVHGLFGDATLWTCSGCAVDYLAGEGWEAELLIARSIEDYCVAYGGASYCNSDLCDTTHPRILAGWIDEVLTAYPGFDQVDLVGHSRGGMTIMTGLWHGYIDPAKVRHAVTLSGANRPEVACPFNNPFPPLPEDETPGEVDYTIYWSNCDQLVPFDFTYVGDGADTEDLSATSGVCLNHEGMRTDAVALAAMANALLLEENASPPEGTVPPPVDRDTVSPTTPQGSGGCFVTTTL